MTTVVPLFDDRNVAARALPNPPWGYTVLDHVESLWPRFQPYADAAFLKEVRLLTQRMASASPPSPEWVEASLQFHRRYWEMYLGCALLDREIELVPHGQRPEHGPDLLAIVSGRRVWVECVAPGSGTTDDAVPELSVGGGVHEVPDDAIKLRLLTALDAKTLRFKDYVQEGLVMQEDARVVAINAGAIHSASLEELNPRIVKVLYGIGFSAVTVKVATGEWSEPYATPQPVVPKKCGKQIEATAFATPGGSELTGVIYACFDAWNKPDEGKRDLWYVENLHAPSPLPFGWLPRAVHYVAAKASSGHGTITARIV